jgi:multisubunit Na+/H+ antiporter MnhB subunit
MMIERLGKWLFPRWQPYRRRREMRTIMVAMGVGLIVAAALAAIILLANASSLGR